MATYHFHFIDGRSLPQTDSEEFAAYPAARTAAVSTLGQMLCDHPNEVFGDHDISVEVADDRGLVLLSVIVTAVESLSAPK